MAKELDDGYAEFWLPSEFLTDDDLLSDFKISSNSSTTKTRRDVCFDSSFAAFGPDLSSPVESDMGTNETDRDDEEEEEEEEHFIAELTRKLARSTNLHHYNLSSDHYATKGCGKLSGSPESTLWGCPPGSGKGSPDSVSSPPSWDTTLYAAAGEAARTRPRVSDETAAFRSTKHFAATMSPLSNLSQIQTQIRLLNHHLQEAQFEEMKLKYQHQQQMIMNKTNMKYNNSIGTRHDEITTRAQAAWPSLQQAQQLQQHQQQTRRPGSGVRAVFLGQAGPKTERKGTGVFMPRRFGVDPAGPRKKPGCSTVLLPDRVVQALNLDLDNLDPHHRSNTGFFPPDYDAPMRHRNNTIKAQQSSSSFSPMHRQELELPQEWTY